MKEYTLAFCFSQTLELMFLRTMPDGKNQGKNNGLGGRIDKDDLTVERQMERFFDIKDSKLIKKRSIMTVELHEGCTPKSSGEPIRLHIIGMVYDHLKRDPNALLDTQIRHKPTYAALIESAEDLVEMHASLRYAGKYVPGFHYFLTETLAVLKREDD